MKPKLVIFDWDGTLADTTNPIIETMQLSFHHCGLQAPEADDIRRLIGYSLPQIMQILAPEADYRTHTELIAAYSGHYLNPNNHHMRLFPDALPCLNELKQQGYWLAVATGKGRTGLDQAIRQTDTADFWLATTCASECPSKPAPDMVFKLCDELGLPAAETVVIGDTTFDLDMAANAKTRGIGITTGTHTAAQLQQSPYLTLLNRLSELPDFLASL